MEYLTGFQPTNPTILVNGYSFTPTFTYNFGPAWHYSLTVAYSSIGLSNSNYCSTASISAEYDACGDEINAETYIMDVSEACGQNGTNTTSTSNSYTYPPFGTGGKGKVTLSPNLELSYPTYLNYVLSLSAGTYDLQGYDNCNGSGTIESPIYQTGPVVAMPGSGTFTVN